MPKKKRCAVVFVHGLAKKPPLEKLDEIWRWGLKRDDPKRGRISVLGPPVKLSRTATSFERLAPSIGEHTDEVLREYGLDAAEIAALRDAKVV